MKIKNSDTFWITFFAVLTPIVVIVYSYWLFFGPDGQTEKNYFYDTENPEEHCMTVIFHSGFRSDEPITKNIGIYIMPYKFEGVLPEENYIRLKYVGAIDPVYYKWSNDTLYLHIPFWGIIENKLSSKVKVNTEPLNYERWGIFDPDTTRNVKDRQEWLQMKKEYRSFEKYDLK